MVPGAQRVRIRAVREPVAEPALLRLTAEGRYSTVKLSAVTGVVPVGPNRTRSKRPASEPPAPILRTPTPAATATVPAGAVRPLMNDSTQVLVVVLATAGAFTVASGVPAQVVLSNQPTAAAPKPRLPCNS